MRAETRCGHVKERGVAVSSIASNSLIHFEKVPCVLMRGGTSRGPFFLESDLPRDREELSRFLIAAMGSPHSLQVDGIGGGNPLHQQGCDRWPLQPSGGGRGLSVRAGLHRPGLRGLQPQLRKHALRCRSLRHRGGTGAGAGWRDHRAHFNRNTSVLVEAVVQTPGGVVDYAGDTAIDGVAGTAAPIRLVFRDAMGSKTGKLLPTGLAHEEINGVPVSLVDYAVPMVLIGAPSLGLEGDETPDSLEADAALLARLEAIRLEAGRRMGLGDVSGIVVPKLALLSAPRTGGTLTSRYFANSRRCHRGHAVTGALCIASASLLPNSIAAGFARPDARRPDLFTLEHPGGRTEVGLERDAWFQLAAASLVRTARRLFEGSVIVPLSNIAA